MSIPESDIRKDHTVQFPLFKPGQPPPYSCIDLQLKAVNSHIDQWLAFKSNDIPLEDLKRIKGFEVVDRLEHECTTPYTRDASGAAWRN